MRWRRNTTYLNCDADFEYSEFPCPIGFHMRKNSSIQNIAWWTSEKKNRLCIADFFFLLLLLCRVSMLYVSNIKISLHKTLRNNQLLSFMSPVKILTIIDCLFKMSCYTNWILLFVCQEQTVQRPECLMHEQSLEFSMDMHKRSKPLLC